MSLSLRCLLRATALAAVAVLLPLAASATHIVEVQAGFEGNLMTVSDAALGCTGSGPTYSCSLNGPLSGTSGGWTLGSMSLTLDEDPSVSAITAVTNNTSVTQTFVLMVTLPVLTPLGPTANMNGSISGSITDTGGGSGLPPDGTATVAAVSGGAIYTALIDGSSVMSLLVDPYSVSTSTSAVVGPNANGPTTAGVSTTTDIGITLRFTLTPGDSASFTSVFTVVPEAGTAALVAAGLLALAGARRRLPRA